MTKNGDPSLSIPHHVSEIYFKNMQIGYLMIIFAPHQQIKIYKVGKALEVVFLLPYIYMIKEIHSFMNIMLLP